MANGDAQVVDLVEGEDVPAAPLVDADVAVIPEGDGDDGGLPSRAKLQPDGSVKLPLLFPKTLRYVRAGGEVTKTEEFAELHMHRLTGADMRAIEAAGSGKMVSTGIGRSCRMELGKFNRVYDMMDAEDADAAGRVFAFFVGAGRKTGR